MNAVARPKANQEIATTRDGRDITRGYTGPLLLPYDKVLRNRGGYDLQIYENVLSEPQVQSTFQQRRNAVVQCEWRVDAASDRRADKKAAKFVRAQLQRIGWDRVTEKMLYGVFYGYAAAEIIYGREGDLVVWDAIKVRNRRRFRFDAEGQLRLLTYSNMFEGEPAPAPYFWHLATGADNDDEPYGLGLAHWCYWPTLFKRNGLKFWMIFLEKFGMPTAVGKYDANASDADKSALLDALGAIQTDSGIIMPKEMEAELLEAARSGTADYRALHETMDATIAKVVLGQTMTTENGASRSQAEVHHDVRQDLVQADSDLVCESFNLGPVRWLCQWNFPDATPPRVYREVDEAEDLKERADRDTAIVGMGFKPTLAYVHETYGGEWTEKADAQIELAPDPAAEFAEGDAAGDQVAQGVQLLERAAAPAMDAWVAKLRALVESAGSLEELRDQLLTAFPDMPTARLADAMRDALAATHLAGRSEILDLPTDERA